MLKTENCEWQELMNVAYKRWQDQNKSVEARLKAGHLSEDEAKKLIWGERDHLLACTVRQRAACIFGKLNYQVENGGFSQWIFNGYAKNAIDFGLVRMLMDMGKASKELLDIVNTLGGMTTSDWQLDEHIDDWDPHEDEWDRLDKWFDRISDAWHSEVYEYLPTLEN